jgi:hypothetical protein
MKYILNILEFFLKNGHLININHIQVYLIIIKNYFLKC